EIPFGTLCSRGYSASPTDHLKYCSPRFRTGSQRCSNTREVLTIAPDHPTIGAPFPPLLSDLDLDGSSFRLRVSNVPAVARHDLCVLDHDGHGPSVAGLNVHIDLEQLLFALCVSEFNLQV